MSKIKSYTYYIETKDGTNETMNQYLLKSVVDDIFDNVSKIIKQYRLQNNPKKIYNMTLFTDTYNISSSDYIKHYSDLPEDKYGSDILDDFDIELINMFN
jgi:hypothetical protein